MRQWLSGLAARHSTIEDDAGRRPSRAGLLLLGDAPGRFHPAAFPRVLRHEGTEPATGTRSNVTLDRRIYGSLPVQIERATELLAGLMPGATRLDPESGRFATVDFLPRFAWREAIVNAVTHRSYSQQGDHARVKLFDDRLEVETPGGLPG